MGVLNPKIQEVKKGGLFSFPSPEMKRLSSEFKKPVEPVVDRSEQEYNKYIEMAKKEDFTELIKYKMVYHSGYDVNLRPILVIVASLIPAKTVDLNKLLLFFISVLDPFVSQDYVLIYVHTNAGSDNIPKFAWLRKCYSIFSRKSKKNLKEVFVVQPTNLIKGLMKLFKPFISNKFWKKLHYIHEIKELYAFMSPQQVQLPIQLLPREIADGKINKSEIFGISLEEVMKHPMNQDQTIPLIVLNCMRYLLRNGTEVEGIFRLSGRAQRIEELKNAYDRGEAVDFSSEPDVHVISGLLKLYFRDLPDPLCTFTLYAEWIAAYDATDLEATKVRMKSLLKKLPTTNYLTLSSLMALLETISNSYQVTKMTAPNLAICWAPNILKPKEESLTSVLNDTNCVNSIVSLLVLHYNYFFPSHGVIEDK